MTKAELITQSMLRIDYLELQLKHDKDNATLREVLEREKALLDAVKSAD